MPRKFLFTREEITAAALALVREKGVEALTARALGEFGAVYALSKTRGKTFTLPLEIDALYLSGSADGITQAFAVSSLLVIMAVIVLVIKNIAEYRGRRTDGR